MENPKTRVIIEYGRRRDATRNCSQYKYNIYGRHDCQNSLCNNLLIIHVQSSKYTLSLCYYVNQIYDTKTVYATTGGSPYVYRNFMVCTQRMGDNEMRRPRAMGGRILN